MNGGGGTASFFAAEAEAFLSFIAERLPVPSHALTLCRVEQATLRAQEGALGFTKPDLSRLDSPGCALRAGRYAALVRFHAPPRLVLAAIERLVATGIVEAFKGTIVTGRSGRVGVLG